MDDEKEDVRSSLSEFGVISHTTQPEDSKLGVQQQLTPGSRLRNFGNTLLEELSHRSTSSKKKSLSSSGHMTPTSGKTPSSGTTRLQHVASTRPRTRASPQQDETIDEDLEEYKDTIEDLKREMESKDVRLKCLLRDVDEKEDALRSLRVELQAVKTRHEEALGLSEKYIAEARLSRDEEVSRLEEEFAVFKSEVEARETRAEREHRDAMGALEGKMDTLKSSNSKVRQENESLLSEMKKMEARVRDAEREKQRAVNKFDAAMRSLDQLEHQYELLEKDAKETEAIKSQRILDLEEEMEELRVSRVQVMQEARRERLDLEQQLDDRMEALKVTEQKYRRAEISATESLRREKAMHSKMEQLEELCDALKSENLSLKDETAKVRGEVERLTGAVEGASQVSRSTEHMLDGYKKENAALKAEVDGFRELLRTSESNLRDEMAKVESLKANVSRLERAMEELRATTAAEKNALCSDMEAVHEEQKTKEMAWEAERNSLKRELEMLHGQVQVLTVRREKPIVQDVSIEKETSDSLVKDVAHELVFDRGETCISEEAQSISFGKPVEEVSAPTPAPTPQETPSPHHSELRQQLAALKLSLLNSSTPRLEKTSPMYGGHSNLVTHSEGSEGPYLQAHRPDIDTDQDSELDSELDDDALSSSDADTLSKARDQVFRAKEYLRRMSSSIEQHS